MPRASVRIATRMLAGAATLALAVAAGAVRAAEPLPALNIDPTGTSVSGLSSGGFMAAQLHVAYSATFRAGAAIVAGGPYYCAQGSVATALTVCMKADDTVKPNTALLISLTNRWAQQKLIDPTVHLAASRVYLFSGTLDSTVKQRGMNEALEYYRYYVPHANIRYKRDLAAEHAMVTDDYGNGCAINAPPYINDCNFDLAGELLQWIYGPLKPRNRGALRGRFIQFDQRRFLPDATLHGLGASGQAYVPSSCAAGKPCRLHVALHGCQQDQTKIGSQFYRQAGYVEWADTNDIVVLFAQTAPSSPGNPNGCWDWWGYDDPSYALKSGRQMAAIKAMVDHVASGAPKR